MERNFKSIQIGDKWGVEVEYYSYVFDEWKTTHEKDWNGDKLLFIRKCDADEWIRARKDIMKIYS